MADVACTIQKILENEEQPGLTVGERFLLRCEGPWPQMDKAGIELRLDEADKNKLKVFDFNLSSATTAELVVTSYVVGQHDLKAVQLTDPQNSVVLNDLKFEVVSVQNPQEPVKEPFPPQGPLTFFPWSFLFAVLLLVILAGVAVGVQFWRGRHRRKLMQQVDMKTFQYQPVPEFYRLARQLQREHLFLTDPKVPTGDVKLPELLKVMDAEFRIFLTRVYRLPAHHDSTRKTLSELSLRKNLDSNLLLELQKALRELDRAKATPEKLQGADLSQILRLMKSSVDRTAKNFPSSTGGAV